jgi:hypothetical protein
MTSELATALFTGYQYKTCEHCGEKGSSIELYCSCAKVVANFGSARCIACGIWYGNFITYKDYLAAWGTLDTYTYYQDEMLYWMPPPCDGCSFSYREEWNAKMSSFTEWRENKAWLYDPWEEEDDSPCGRFAICPCCGESRGDYD